LKTSVRCIRQRTEDKTSCYSYKTSIKVFLSSFPHHTGSVSNPLSDDSGWSRERLQRRNIRLTETCVSVSLVWSRRGAKVIRMFPTDLYSWTQSVVFFTAVNNKVHDFGQ